MKMQTIRISEISEGYNPRKDFGEEEDLLKDIQQHGLETPIGVRLEGDKPVTFEGNRRLRVLKKLGQEEVQCVVKDMDEKTAAHRSYLHNTGKLRKNLNPIEEAAHLKWLQDKFNYSVKNLVDEGYANDDQTVYNKLSLLNLPEEAQQKVAKGEISPTIGYELAKKAKTEAQAKKLVKNLDKIKDLSVKKAKKVISQIDLEDKPAEEKPEPPQVPKGQIVAVHMKDPELMSEVADESAQLILALKNKGGDGENGEIKIADYLQLLGSLPAWGEKLTPGGFLCLRFSDVYASGMNNKTDPEVIVMGHEFQNTLSSSSKVRLQKIFILDKSRAPGKKPEDLFSNKTKHTSYGYINNFEYIYIFKKDGSRQAPDDLDLISRITMEEWKTWGFPIWQIAPKKKEDYKLTLNEEIARRLIRMYSFVGDMVVDTSLGTGTTLELARELGRGVIGYEGDLTYFGDIMKKGELKATGTNEVLKPKQAGNTVNETMERISSMHKAITAAKPRDAAIPAVVAKLERYEDCSEPQSDQGEEVKETDETLKPPHVGESMAMVAGSEEGVL